MLNLRQYVSHSLTPCKQFSTTQSLSKKNHYDTLGITPSATLNEIKKAYYNLSMLYHPDKSNGSVEALEKFRDVTEAYETLSNLTSKRLYDKGVLRRSPLQGNKPMPIKRETVIIPNPSRMPIYNFDLWTKSHYGESVARRAATKQKFEEEKFRKETNIAEDKLMIFIFSLVLVLGSSYLLIEVNTSNADTPFEKKT